MVVEENKKEGVTFRLDTLTYTQLISHMHMQPHCAHTLAQLPPHAVYVLLRELLASQQSASNNNTHDNSNNSNNISHHTNDTEDLFSALFVTFFQAPLLQSHPAILRALLLASERFGKFQGKKSINIVQKKNIIQSKPSNFDCYFFLQQTATICVLY